MIQLLQGRWAHYTVTVNDAWAATEYYSTNVSNAFLGIEISLSPTPNHALQACDA